MNRKTSRTAGSSRPQVRCAIYTRKSTEEGLEQEFNSLDAQRESAQAYIASQASEGWTCLATSYDDGGFTGGNMNRPALQRLLDDVRQGHIDCVVTYKVDRLSRSLLDFARMMEIFEKHRVSFVSVTQQFNSATSMGRLVLNVLLSFAQFEREIVSERTRDKIAATRRKGKWSGGRPPLGYDVDPITRKLVINEEEAARVAEIFALYLEHQALLPVVLELHRRGWVNKRWRTRAGIERGSEPFSKVGVARLLANVLYRGQVGYQGEVHPGEQPAIIDAASWLKVQASLRQRSSVRPWSGQGARQPRALLTGRLWCPTCGQPMVPTHTANRSGTRYRYYVCRARRRSGCTSCAAQPVPAAAIEQFVIEQIRRLGRDAQWQQALVAAARREDQSQRRQRQAESAALTRDLARRQAALRAAAREIQAGRNAHSVVTRIAELQTEISQLEERQRLLRGQMATAADVSHDRAVIQALASLDTAWDRWTPALGARVVEWLVERVDYHGDTGNAQVTFQATALRALVKELAPRVSESAP